MMEQIIIVRFHKILVKGGNKMYGVKKRDGSGKGRRLNKKRNPACR